MLSNGETNHGFIAQVKTAIDNHPEIKDGFKMWSQDYREDEDGNAIADGRQRVAPAELIPILTKAIQELSAKNDALETRIAALEENNMSGYIGPIPVPQGIQNKETFTATAGQTTFNTNGYTDGAFTNVYLNGVRLINGTTIQPQTVVMLCLHKQQVLVMYWTLKHSMSLV